MNAKRRMSANDISNKSDLSNTFIVAMMRHDPRDLEDITVCDWAIGSGRKQHQWLVVGVWPGVWQHDWLSRKNGEQLSEGSIKL